ncbi:member of the karyopherin-beta [Friedmanniomyces endolithicus]|nr:member of the karyopherin-beta [Friedmanniomyces endolithicus]
MEGNGSSVVPPQSVAEAETLVKRLYQSGPAKMITEINDQLLKLQHAPEGWQLADALMSSSDQNVRFFAANTFTVKLNNDGPKLDVDTARTIQMRLVSWLVRLSRQGEGAMVIRKLCSTLTTFFIRSPSLWRRPLMHVGASLQTGGPVTEDEAIDLSAERLSEALNSSETAVLLWFSASLADEVSRLDNNTPAHSQVHRQMEETVQDASALLATAFRTPDPKVRAEGLKSFLTWVNYAQPMWPRKPEALQHLRNLIESASQALTDPTLQHDALDIFRDILESYTSFFQSHHMQLIGRIVSEYVQPKLLDALRDGDAEGLPYGQMVTAFGVANVLDIVEHPETSDSASTVIRLHFDILKAPGYPGDEDELSVLSIEFWNTYIEYVNDTVFSQDAEEQPATWIPYAKSVLSQLIELLWTKMCTPPANLAKNWTDAEHEGFKEFRLDATDLMLSIFVFLGKAMLQQLVALILQSLDNKNWRAVEAAMFCLNALADNVLEDQAGDDVLAGLFGSRLFRDAGDFSQTIPLQARRTAIDVLGSYGQYVERHAEYLPDTVRFLFASLENAQLSHSAAKSIAALCSACRGSLTGELQGFLQQYQLLSGPTADPYTKERVLGAIAAIIQALKPESAKVLPLLALLENVEKDMQMAKSYATDGDLDAATTFGVMGLNCLATIGMNLQNPEDVPINVYDDDEQHSSEQAFWDNEEAKEVQQRIMGCFSVLEVLGNDGDAIEAACHVLRSGFAETEPGPFVLPAFVTVRFLQQCSVTTPRLEFVLSTACILITQQSRSNSIRIPDEVNAICEQVVTFIQQLGHPSQDPSIAQGCIDVFCRLIPYYIHLLFEPGSALSQQLPTILNFTLQAIQSPDIFPRRSAAEFWAKLIRPLSIEPRAGLQQDVAEVVAAYVPQLSQILIYQIGGLGQRSELDYLCEPLKALIANVPSAKHWLEAALFSDGFAAITDRVGDAEKSLFLKKIVGLRGDNRKTKDVVREFYAACRGTVVSYG